jgi:hypothetical protein
LSVEPDHGRRQALGFFEIPAGAPSRPSAGRLRLPDERFRPAARTPVAQELLATARIAVADRTR